MMVKEHVLFRDPSCFEHAETQRQTSSFRMWAAVESLRLRSHSMQRFLNTSMRVIEKVLAEWNNPRDS